MMRKAKNKKIRRIKTNFAMNSYYIGNMYKYIVYWVCIV